MGSYFQWKKKVGVGQSIDLFDSEFGVLLKQTKGDKVLYFTKYNNSFPPQNIGNRYHIYGIMKLYHEKNMKQLQKKQIIKTKYNGKMMKWVCVEERAVLQTKKSSLIPIKKRHSITILKKKEKNTQNISLSHKHQKHIKKNKIKFDLNKSLRGGKNKRDYFRLAGKRPIIWKTKDKVLVVKKC